MLDPTFQREQNHAQSEIIKHILEKTLLERIFPLEAWETEPLLSGAKSMNTLARTFFDRGDMECALECVEQSNKFFENHQATIMKAFILRALGNNLGAADLFAKTYAALDPHFAGMNVPLHSSSVKQSTQKILSHGGTLSGASQLSSA